VKTPSRKADAAVRSDSTSRSGDQFEPGAPVSVRCSPKAGPLRSQAATRSKSELSLTAPLPFFFQLLRQQSAFSSVQGALEEGKCRLSAHCGRRLSELGTECGWIATCRAAPGRSSLKYSARALCSMLKTLGAQSRFAGVFSQCAISKRKASCAAS
jgi:hypothetical protein